jgi:hypothetical protein
MKYTSILKLTQGNKFWLDKEGGWQVGSSWRFGLVVERRSRKAKITGSIPVSAFFFPHAIYFSFSRIFSNYPFSLCLF